MLAQALRWLKPYAGSSLTPAPALQLLKPYAGFSHTAALVLRWLQPYGGSSLTPAPALRQLQPYAGSSLTAAQDPTVVLICTSNSEIGAQVLNYLICTRHLFLDQQI